MGSFEILLIIFGVILAIVLFFSDLSGISRISWGQYDRFLGILGISLDVIGWVIFVHIHAIIGMICFIVGSILILYAAGKGFNRRR